LANLREKIMAYGIDDLRKIMQTLRSEQGCNWDKQQTFDSLAPYAIEEAHEVAEAIAQKNYPHVCDELGDLLLQVVFQSQIAQEQNLFNFDDVVNAISQKMIRRHPHVFEQANNLTPEQVSQQWADIKAQEQALNLDQTTALFIRCGGNRAACLNACRKNSKNGCQNGL
jgi:ATP diphosphatase